MADGVGAQHEEKIGSSEFVGYRLVEFSTDIKRSLREVAEVLIPHSEQIVANWIALQFSTWEPPGISRQEVEALFASIFGDMLACMKIERLERCIENLERAGADLARREFPYEALIISLHFLEESYIEYLLSVSSDRSLDWLLGMDEFLHAALAAIATSYFQAHRRQLLEEAEVGRIVQEGLLPDIPSRIGDLEIAYVYLPSGEHNRIGGDLVDVFSIDERETAFIVGDLSGHGLEGATDAAMIRALFRGFMRESRDLAAAMGRLNRVLEKELAPGQFATAVAGIYSEGGAVRVVNAGHPSPVVSEGTHHMLDAAGIALAVDPGATFAAREFTLERDAMLVSYTDGLIEARRGKEFFGEEGVVAALDRVRDVSARAIAEYLRDEALRFAGGALKDDVAILVLRRRAP